jgi:hypothetical protein
MRIRIMQWLLSIIVAFGHIGSSKAVPLGLPTSAPTIESSFALFDFFEFGPDGDLSTFGAVVDFADGAAPVGLAEIGLGFGFGLADPTIGAAGGFFVVDDNGLFLDGILEAVGFTEDIIELQFGSLGGAASADFGETVLALIAFDDPLGPNPFLAFNDGDLLTAAISISSVVAVSEPSTLALLAPVLLGIGWFRQRRRSG